MSDAAAAEARRARCDAPTDIDAVKEQQAAAMEAEYAASWAQHCLDKSRRAE